jgi:alpha-tubulin suppressor-like RCC1 family protein
MIDARSEGSTKACMLLIALVAILASGALAQVRPSVLTGWGGYAFDTRGRDQFVVEVNAGYQMSAVRTASGRIFVNGGNRWSTASVPPLPTGRSYVQMDVKPGGGAAVVDDGTVVVWGADYHPAHVPTGILTFPPAPLLPSGMTYLDVSAGASHVLAMRSDWQLIAWGDNSRGQCNVPTLAPGQSVVRMRAIEHTNYLFLNDGTMVIFGDQQGGQAIPPPGAYSAITRGLYHWLALRTDGQIVAWGDNSNGECNVPPLPPGLIYTAVAAGAGHSHAIRSDGSIVTWGQLWGLPAPPTLVAPAGTQFAQIACGWFHLIAVTTDGRVLTWGFNWYFEGYVPGLIELQGSNPAPLHFVHCSTGRFGAVAVLSDGRLVGWGDPWMPSAALTNNRRFTKVSYGVNHHAALTDTGEVIAWGDPSYGATTIPLLPPGVTYVDLDCSLRNTVLLRSDGQAVVVGSNSDGQLNVPPLPPGLTYIACDSHERRTVLLRSDGQVFSFGMPTSPNPNVVPPLPPGLVYTDIAASQWFNSALRSDGSVVMFGGLSNPLTSPQWRNPGPLPFGVYYVEADGGDRHVVLRRSDGLVEVAGHVYHTLNAAPLPDPGTSYVQVSGGYEMSIGRIGAESTYVGIAPGCAGSRPASRLVPRDTPKIGRPLVVTLFDLPHDLAMLVMSFQQLTPPVSLASLGMPGCHMHLGLDASVLLSGQNQQATWSLQVPDQLSLLGLVFYHQALVFDLQAGNSFGAVVSDTMRGVVGDR